MSENLRNGSPVLSLLGVWDHYLVLSEDDQRQVPLDCRVCCAEPKYGLFTGSHLSKVSQLCWLMTYAR